MLKYNKNAKLSVTITNWRRKISCYKYSFLEFLALKIDLFYQMLINWRKAVFLNEIKMANISSKDKVLFIGGGILPSESILITEVTNAKVVTIDNNVNACKHAQKYIQNKGLSNKITIEHAEGKNYPVQDFDVIFIAINVWPIDSVLRNLYENMKPNARVMCKSYRNDIIEVFENEGLLESFHFESKLENPVTQSFLFVKKK